MRYTDETDLELAELAKQDDHAAFGELVKRHRGKTYAQCVKIMQDTEEAEDRVQDALTKAYTALPGFRQEARFSTWLYAIARNACLMRLREKQLPTVPLDQPMQWGAEAIEQEVADPKADSSAEVLRDELRSVLERHISNLSPLNRAIFELRLIHGRSTEETARQLGLSVPAVKSRLHAARVSLRCGLLAYLRDGCATA